MEIGSGQFIGAKVTASLLTLVTTIAAGVVILATMVIAMNGFSESDAMWGFGTFILLALVVAVLMALGAFFLAGFLLKKRCGSVVSAIIPVLVFSITGAGLEIILSLIGVAVAEFVRVNY